jgi:hypothetical protein
MDQNVKFCNFSVPLCHYHLLYVGVLGILTGKIQREKPGGMKSLRKKKRKKAGFKTNEIGLKRTKEGEVKKDLLGG